MVQPESPVPLLNNMDLFSCSAALQMSQQQEPGPCIPVFLTTTLQYTHLLPSEPFIGPPVERNSSNKGPCLCAAASIQP